MCAKAVVAGFCGEGRRVPAGNVSTHQTDIVFTRVRSNGYVWELPNYDDGRLTGDVHYVGNTKLVPDDIGTREVPVPSPGILTPGPDEPQATPPPPPEAKLAPGGRVRCMAKSA